MQLTMRLASLILVTASGVAFAATAGLRSAAEPPPTASLQAHVVPTAVRSSSGTTTIEYRVENAAASTDSIDMVLIDAPTGSIQIRAPEPQGSYYVSARFGDRHVAYIGFVGRRLRPGQRAGGFSIDGAGVPGIVPFWAMAYEPLDSVIVEDVDTAASEPELFSPGRLSGYTVGIVAPPADLSAPALIARLDSLVTESCHREWVTPEGVCRSLRAKVAAGQMGALVRELDAQRGRHVGETAYFLIRANAELVPGRR